MFWLCRTRRQLGRFILVCVILLFTVDGQAVAVPWNLEQIRQPQAQARLQAVGVLRMRPVVAVLDTGVAVRGLEGRLVRRVDGSYEGYSFVSDPHDTIPRGGSAILAEPTAPTDVSGMRFHGTHVASIVAQVCSDCDILPVRVLGAAGYGSDTDIADGIRWASGETVRGIPGSAVRPAHVLNLSVTTPLPAPAMKQAIAEVIRRGVIVVAAAGNQSRYAAQYAPAALPDVIAVGGALRSGSRACYSNYGDRVNLLAPGGLIPSMADSAGCPEPMPGDGIAGLPEDSREAPAVLSERAGSSQAAPHVSAAAALAKAIRPSLQQRALARLLRDSATTAAHCDLAPVTGCGAGLLDMDALVLLSSLQANCPCPGDLLCQGSACVDPGPVAPATAEIEAGCTITNQRSTRRSNCRMLAPCLVLGCASTLIKRKRGQCRNRSMV